MGVLDRLFGRKLPERFEPVGGLNFVDPFDARIDLMSVEDLYRDQPHLRTVTSFLARMVSTVSLHVYERTEDGSRVRVRDSELAGLMKQANGSMLTSTLLNRTVMDLCLYDEWVWLIGGDAVDGQWQIYPIPPRWIVKRHFSDVWTFSGVTIRAEDGRQRFIGAEHLIRHAGYNPASLQGGSSPIHALKDTLKQNKARAKYQEQLWDRGPRMAGFIERPLDARWDADARRNFKAALRAQFSGAGSGAGGIAVLEDGMKFVPHHLKASDEQVVEQIKLSLETVAQVYHVNPTMVGILDNANYSNVKEFRQLLYGDTLMPIMKSIEDSINAFLVPRLEPEKAGRVYVEFNMQERLRARFEDQADVTSRAVGAPWMTRNEARAMNNLPMVDGGDVLAEPLNTSFGGDGP